MRKICFNNKTLNTWKYKKQVSRGRVVKGTTTDLHKDPKQTPIPVTHSQLSTIHPYPSGEMQTQPGRHSEKQATIVAEKFLPPFEKHFPMQKASFD